MQDPPKDKVVPRDLASKEHGQEQRSGCLLQGQNGGRAGLHRSKALHHNEGRCETNPFSSAHSGFFSIITEEKL